MKKSVILLLAAAVLCTIFTGCGKSEPDINDGIFSAFFGDELKAVVDEGVSLGCFDYEKEYVGREFTFSELCDTVTAKQAENAPEPQITYFRPTSAKGSVLMLGFGGLTDNENGPEYCSYLALAIREGRPVITFSIDSGYRSYAEINAAGMIRSGGSAGAGDHIADLGFINGEGEYISIYDSEECYTGWFEALFAYCEKDIFSENTAELARQADSTETEDIIALYVIGDNVYGIISTEEQDRLSGLMSSAEADGLRIVFADEIDSVISDYAASLGIGEDMLNAYAAEWLAAE